MSQDYNPNVIVVKLLNNFTQIKVFQTCISATASSISDVYCSMPNRFYIDDICFISVLFAKIYNDQKPTILKCFWSQIKCLTGSNPSLGIGVTLGFGVGVGVAVGATVGSIVGVGGWVGTLVTVGAMVTAERVGLGTTFSSGCDPLFFHVYNPKSNNAINTATDKTIIEVVFAWPFLLMYPNLFRFLISAPSTNYSYFIILIP